MAVRMPTAAPWLAGLITLLAPAGSAGNDADLMYDPKTGQITSAGWAALYNNPEGWKDSLSRVGEIFGDLGRIGVHFDERGEGVGLGGASGSPGLHGVLEHRDAGVLPFHGGQGVGFLDFGGGIGFELREELGIRLRELVQVVGGRAEVFGELRGEQFLVQGLRPEQQIGTR